MTSISNRRHAIKGFATAAGTLAGIAAGLFRGRAARSETVATGPASLPEYPYRRGNTPSLEELKIYLPRPGGPRGPLTVPEPLASLAREFLHATNAYELAFAAGVGTITGDHPVARRHGLALDNLKDAMRDAGLTVLLVDGCAFIRSEAADRGLGLGGGSPIGIVDGVFITGSR